MKIKVLFVCVHNSARSQMAEAFLDQICGHHFEAHSAGLEPGKLNPIVVEAMREIGLDISGNRTKSVSDYEAATAFANGHVITVCDQASAEHCPNFAGIVSQLRWSFPDPSGFQGTHDEKLAQTREVRDAIKAKIEEWCADMCRPFSH